MDKEAGLLYQVDERPPVGLTVGLGLQFAILNLGGILLAPTIVYRIAGADEATLAWVVFATLLITGAIAVLNAFPLGRFGAGYVLLTGAAPAAVTVSIDAIAAGGAALLASLMFASALFQLVFSYWISMFRRIITPVVSGTIMMLLPVPIMPIAFRSLTDVPAGMPQSAGLACALTTLILMILVVLKGTRKLLPWNPLIGICGGAVVAGFLGFYDFEQVMQASWVGLPPAAWTVPAIDVGASFWALLPAFMLITMSGTISTISSSLAIQDVSWRKSRAPDLRATQGAVAANAAANFLAGLGGSVLHWARPTTVSMTKLTGIGSRWVGLAFGGILAAFAFLPKISALILALPAAVLSAYLVVILATVFVTGARMVVAAGLDHRQMMIVGLSFWIGIGCQYGLLLPDILPEFAGGVLANGLASGGMSVILLTAMLEFSSGRRRKLETDLDISRLPELREFISRFAADYSWPAAMIDRLEAVAEETLLTLNAEQPGKKKPRRLKVIAHREGGAAIIEFIAKSGDSNIEDRISLLGDIGPGQQLEREVSLRLLRHLAQEVRHRQYHDMDFVTVRVELPQSNTGG